MIWPELRECQGCSPRLSYLAGIEAICEVPRKMGVGSGEEEEASPPQTQSTAFLGQVTQATHTCLQPLYSQVLSRPTTEPWLRLWAFF